MSFVAAGLGVASIGAGLFSSRKANKTQKQAIALQREQLAYAQQKDAENKALYGGITQQVVDQAAKGVDPNLTQVSNEAATDAKAAFAGAQGALERNQQRMGINPNSGRAESQLQDAKLSEALAVAGGTTKARQVERNNAETQTFNRRVQVAQMGAGQMNNSANAVTNASNNVAGALSNQSAQQSADAAGYASAAVNFGLKAFDKYGATPPAVKQPTGATGSGVYANQPSYASSRLFEGANTVSASPIGNTSIAGATNAFLSPSLVPRAR